MENFESKESLSDEEKEIKGLFNQLSPRDQLLRLMLLIDMPKGVRPPASLTIGEREKEILNWAKKENYLKILADTLKSLIERQQI